MAARCMIVVLLVAVALAACGPASSSSGAASPAAPDPTNATFRIEKDSVTLVNGRAEREAAPGSASKVITILGTERATADLDNDGRLDTAVLLTQQPGGSGTFFYVAVLLNGAGGVTPVPAVLLGDRIKLTALRVDGRVLVVELLDHAPGDPLTASPTVAKTKRFVVDGGTLVAQ